MSFISTSDAAEPVMDEHRLRSNGVPSFRRSKFSPACTACRNFKTRCFPGPSLDSCQPCINRSKPCIYPGPAKRRLKSSEKISELEKKIELLTTVLARRHYPGPPKDQEPPDMPHPAPVTELSTTFSIPSRTSEPDQEGHQRGTTLSVHLDVITQGIMDMPTAEVLFNHWNNAMRPILPIVNFPSTATVAQIREKYPVLFLAILAVASASILPSFQDRLTLELNEQLSHYILVLGRRSIELAQACLIFSQYYIAPAGTQPFSSTTHISTATAVLCDLGLNQDNIEGSRQNLDSDTFKESATTWLVCCNAIVLRQPCQMPPTSNIERLLDLSLADADGSLSQKWLGSLIRLQSIMENASHTLHRTSAELFDHPSSQYQLKMAERRLESWKTSIPEGVDARLSKLLALCADLCIHHVAIRSFSHKALASCGGELACHWVDKEIPLVDSHFTMLCRCLESTQGVLDIYLALEDAFARSLPNSYLLWILYAAVVLIKLRPFEEYAQSRGSAASLIDVSAHESTVYYLDAMIQKMSRLCYDGYHPQSRSAGLALLKLRAFYAKKREVCINALGGCAVPDARGNGRVYSVFGHDAESTLPEGDMELRSAQEETHAPNTKPKEPAWQQERLDPGGNSTLGVSDRRFASSSSPDEGSLQIVDQSGPEASVYDPTVFANTNWEEFTWQSEEMKDLETLVMDWDIPWMKSLF